MSEGTQTPRTGSSLQLAQDFVRSVEAKDLAAVTQTLAPGAQQLFMHTRKTRTPAGVAGILSGESRGRSAWRRSRGARRFSPTPGSDGEVLSSGVARRGLAASADDEQVFFSGKGDMVVARSGKPYRNSYATIFEFEGGKVRRMFDYADAFAGGWTEPLRLALRRAERVPVVRLRRTAATPAARVLDWLNRPAEVPRSRQPDRTGSPRTGGPTD